MPQANAPDPLVSARCHLSYAFEVGQGIDLAACERLLARAARRTVSASRRTPPGFAYRPAPLRLGLDAAPTPPLGLIGHEVEAVLYDFGAATINLVFGYRGTLGGLRAVSGTLQSGDPALATFARTRVATLIESLGAAVDRPLIGPDAEDYLIIELEHATAPKPFPSSADPMLAGILRGTAEPLSDQEVAAAFGSKLRYQADDLTLIDWNAAILVDREPDDTRAVLEFANVQLLELRHLDAELDRAIESAYQLLAHTGRRKVGSLFPRTQSFRHLATLQIDAAVLFERVTNALKLVGDQFLSLVYQAAAGRFHLGDWDRAIARKLDVLDGIYQKVGDRISSRRLEILEWIVIILIAAGILVGL